MADINNFPSNSLKVRENKELNEIEGTTSIMEKPAKKLELSAPVKTKTSFGSALKRSFFSEDIPDIKQHILTEYVVPGVKNLISDILHSTLDAIFYGGSIRNGYYRSNNTVFNYNKIGQTLSRGIYNIYNDPYANSIPVGRTNEKVGSGYLRYNDICLGTRKDTEMVIMEMNEMIRTYGQCRVADLYQFVGLDADSSAYKFGWSSLEGARSTPSRDGWRLELPKAKPLNIIN